MRKTALIMAVGIKQSCRMNSILVAGMDDLFQLHHALMGGKASTDGGLGI